jgi:hypothetical protein
MKTLKLNIYKKYFSISTSSNESKLLVPKRMKAILQSGKGDANTLFIGETETPVIIKLINLFFQIIFHRTSRTLPKF